MSIVESLKKKINTNTDKKSSVVEPKSDAPVAKAGKEFTDEEKKAFTGIILQTRVTEKTSGYESSGIYTFNVGGGTTKPQIKRAIEKMYHVNIVDIRTVTIPRKRRMRGRLQGWKKGYKKALVKVKAGQTIEVSS